MSALAAASAVLLALMLAVALFNLLTAPRLERAGEPGAFPRVSVLVPARNEAANLRETLPRLLRLDYPAVEVLVLDDGSEDGTDGVMEAHLHDARLPLRLLTGAPLPAGWLGKSWACHQLAEAAEGEVLVFCDADVSVRPDALRRTVAALQRVGAGAATALPRQRLGSWPERAVVPLVAHLPVLALLPLRLVPSAPSPALSMANGQWLAFTRAAYRASGGHAAVRGEVVEDVALGRRVKAAGHRLLPLVASAALSVRMYRGAGELREGFGKNLYALAGGRPIPFALALALFLLAAVYPWVGVLAGARGAGIPLALLLAVRGCGMLLFRHGWRSLLLHPAGSLLVAGIALESLARARRGALVWKGRRLGPAPEGAESSAGAGG